MHALSLVALVSLSLPMTYATTYMLSDNWLGAAFLSTFVHEAISDPTHGRVNYVDQATAVSKNLTYAEDNTLVLRADYTTVLDPNGPGRDSVRIRSVKTYTTHVVVFDIAHMPQGCGTWPAAWETDPNDWPNGGEVDIMGMFRRDFFVVQVEGVNDQSPNSISLHTGSDCTMPSSRTMTGTAIINDCDVNTDGNTGCGVEASTADSYGPSFNAIGGGWYAMERTSDFIKVWFWERSANTPSDLGAATIDTDDWGTPTAYFPNTSCDIDSQFDENNIIINLTFCGDWAGQDSVYSSSGCPSTCVDYVNNNPSAFVDAYWQFNSVRVYE